MSCNGVTIASHLLNNHKLTLNDYEREYLIGSDSGKEPIKEMPPIKPPAATVQSQVVEGDHFLADAMESQMPLLVPQANLSREEIAARRDRPWYQKCQYFCQICNQSYFSISALRNHTKVYSGVQISLCHSICLSPYIFHFFVSL